MNNDEIVFSQCEQILQADKTSQELNKRILQHEAHFKKSLNEEQLKEYLELEELIIASAAYNEACIYKNAKHGG